MDYIQRAQHDARFDRWHVQGDFDDRSCDHARC